jgi:flagellar basal-body rod protein FlgC
MSVDPIAISRSALDVEWQRMQVIAENLANESTTRVAGGGPWRPLELISGPTGFSAAMERGSSMSEPHTVAVLTIEPRGGLRRIYDPNHPDADANGLVAYPAIDHAGQMAALVKTARVYESNLTVMSLAQQMTMRALEIGKR